MANTFFEFDTSLNQNGDGVLPPDDDDYIENEDDYDALNDETFGTLEDASNVEDWEQQHEQFAEREESSKISEKFENSISQLVLDDSDNPLSSSAPLSNSVWSYTPTKLTPSNKNGDIFNTSILSSLQKASKSFIEAHSENSPKSIIDLNLDSLPSLSAQPKKICTVEELEKNLIKTSKNATGSPQQQLPLPRPMGPPTMGPGHPAFHPMMQHPIPNTRLPPPGLPPMNIPPPGLRHLPPHMNPHHPQLLPPGYMRLVSPHPQFLQNKGPPLPPGFMYPHGSQNQFPMNHPFNFPPGVRHPGNVVPMSAQQHQQQRNQQMFLNAQQQQQRIRHDSNNYKQYKEREESRDEYSGLMSMREKQWLLNIQMLQLNTGTPYFDDYYYTIFKERKTKNNRDGERTPHQHNKRQHRNSDRQENQNTLTPRVYTPLQFENSLGKLQCGSVTAPRKIIDMDIVTPDKDADNIQISSRDSRKTKQLLIELEALYALLLKAEDLDNPLYKTNMEKLREMKQKQRLRELELAPTPEQKQEVLRLFKLESEPVVEHQYDYLIKIVQGLLQEDKFSSFLNIRKGKMLVLRLLPHLKLEGYSSQLLDLWSKVLLSLCVTGRRDTAGDNILPRYYPHFKRFIQASSMTDILEMVSTLTEIVRPESNRSTPLSHVGKSPLYFVLTNKFGVSALCATLLRVEMLIALEEPTEKQLNDWSNFLVSWAQQTESVSKVAEPIEPIKRQTFEQHCRRLANLKPDKRSSLEKHYVGFS